MDQPAPIAAITVPLGGQKIEMHQIDHAEGGLSLLRVRIREGSRFTVFDIDPGTAAAWGGAMQDWSRSQAGSPQ